MPDQPIVTIIGAGRIGQALGLMITESQSATCRLWDSRPELRQPAYATIAEAVAGADVVILAVPTTTFATIRPTLTALPTTTAIVTLSKGAPEPTTLSPAEYLQANLPRHPIVVLGGPMMAEEMSVERPGQAVIASTSTSAQQLVSTILRHAHLACTLSDKPIDVSRSSVLKNVFACTVGMIDGGDLPGETHRRGHELAREEFFRTGEALGIDRDVLSGPAGLGDFLTTIHSPHSRNRRAGEELVRNGVHDQSAESIHSIGPVVAALDPQLPVPLLRGAAKIVAGTASPQSLYQLISVV